jgi:hypothetical protein
MAKRVDTVSYAAEIEEVMRTTNLMRPEAAALVARRHGKDVSDIVGPGGRPLTAEERVRLGLGRSFADYDPNRDELEPAIDAEAAAIHR